MGLLVAESGKTLSRQPGAEGVVKQGRNAVKQPLLTERQGKRDGKKEKAGHKRGP